jgi:3-phenylpropionate/trans-cinnamate dioxygenase ferredoxin subunit
LEDKDWVFAAEESELEDGRAAVDVNGRNILLIRKDGEIFALENSCPHMNCRLTKGELRDYNLKCPCHGWEFDIRSGEFVTAPKLKLAVYPAKMDDYRIYVGMGK